VPDWTFPVLFDDARVSSGLGSRVAPLPGASTNHRGIDIAAPAGTPVVAPTDLAVIYAGQAGGYGNVIYANDASGNQFRFAHLQSFGVRPGDTISQGGYLGAVGSTGNSTGNHLHFEIRDKAGNVLRNAMNSVVQNGKRLVTGSLGDAVNSVLKSNPATAPFAIGADLLGVNPLGGGDGCGINPMCYLQKWLEETAFVQRSALYILASILIIAGVVFLAKGYNPVVAAQKALT
jgi:murein DD-endopeptidase MepM/ murein hydrolase activator NlpD